MSLRSLESVNFGDVRHDWIFIQRESTRLYEINYVRPLRGFGQRRYMLRFSNTEVPDG